MINLNQIKAILEAQEAFIEPGDRITKELVDLFHPLQGHRWQPFFKKQPVKRGPQNPKYFVETVCKTCKSEHEEQMCKTRVWAYILHQDFVCDRCEQDQRDRDLAARKLQDKKHDSKKQENTYQFIDIYLDPNKHWVADVPVSSKIEQMESLLQRSKEDEVKEWIKLLSYKDFLNTPYWKAIAEDARKRFRYKCGTCAASGSLHVHHNSYDHHGEELRYRRTDLICLCADCHQTFHDQREVTSQWRKAAG